ncbi:hypothetical protein [Cereibacter sediminicola]|uniref:hypothetical protein n=1 Tax=Cereibacter sediminicola TaxID=2584941 RepID=UPI0011A8A964|nr:hypothetical protein [Cereibacter sediminicola]
MTGETKILTVTCGGLCCRLEGFDDPFSLLKDVADPLRDLAAKGLAGSDPTELRRLFRKDGARGVEVEVTAEGLVLRPAPEEDASLAARLSRLRSAVEEVRRPRPRTSPAAAGSMPEPAPPAHGPGAPGRPPSDLGPAPAPEVEARLLAQILMPEHPDAPDSAPPLRLEHPCPPGTLATEADDMAIRTLVAETRALQEREEAEERARTLDRARARIAMPRTEPDPLLLQELSRIETDLAHQPAPFAAGRQLAEATGEDAVERILDKTTNEMRAPESRRRISALSHLKAAVAATVADRMAGGLPAGGETRMDAYRDDLARVVRPSDLSAPLLLGLEQRIDPARPVRTGSPGVTENAREADALQDSAPLSGDLPEHDGADGTARRLRH